MRKAATSEELHEQHPHSPPYKGSSVTQTGINSNSSGPAYANGNTAATWAHLGLPTLPEGGCKHQPGANRTEPFWPQAQLWQGLAVDTQKCEKHGTYGTILL